MQMPLAGKDRRVSDKCAEHQKEIHDCLCTEENYWKSEAEKAISLLAAERDAWGKRETELMREAGKLQNQLSDMQLLMAVNVDLESKCGRLRKALESIIDYGTVLQPLPVHPVTYNACAIAYEALYPEGEKGAL